MMQIGRVELFGLSQPPPSSYSQLLECRAELLKWRLAAAAVSLGIPGEDVSTPENFQRSQADAIRGMLQRIRRLEDL